MKALIYDRHGGPDVLRYLEVPEPEPDRRDVVVEVAATALNHLDIVQRAGHFTLPLFQLPHVAGMDVVGTVVAVGSESDTAMIGRRVVVDPSLAGAPDGSRLSGMGDLYGSLGVIGGTVAGGYAERCLVPDTHVYELPAAMGWERAAAFPTAWLTAHHGLFDRGRLAAGETVLIHAAGSGVSTAAIQLALAAGAIVLATAGTDAKCARALDLGAHFAANNRTVDVAVWAREATDGAGVDMVFDHVGPALWAASLHSLKPRGRLVNCGNTSGDSATIGSLGHLFHMGISIIGSDPYRPSEFAAAWSQFSSRPFEAVIDSRFALADGASAHHKLANDDVFGKVLLIP